MKEKGENEGEKREGERGRIKDIKKVRKSK